MDTRKRNILKELMASNTPITAGYLGQILEVSSRTIREDIKDLNHILSKHGAEVKSTRGIGYELEIIETTDFHSFLSDRSQKTVADNQLPNSPESRIVYIIKKFLLSEKYIKLEDLADEMHVSKSTLQLDLKSIRTILKSYNLQLNSLPNYGLKIEGKELNRRFAISEYVFNRDHTAPDLLWIDQLSTITHSDKETLTNIWRLLINKLDENNVSLSDIAVNNLFVHIAIAYKRIKNGHSINLVQKDLKDIESQKEYEVAKNIVKEVEQIWQVSFPDIEVAYITIHLLGTKMINESLVSEKKIENIMDNNIKSLAISMVESIDDELNLGIQGDTELLVGLCLHLKPALNRYKYGMNIRNPLLNDIKTNYPLAFEAGLIASLVLYEKLNITIDENEIAYLALHIGAAIERQKLEHTPKRCYIVCASGVGSSQLIRYRIESEFHSQIIVEGVTEYYRINEIPLNKIDFIISTVPIKHDLPIPIIEVNAILSEKDITKVGEFVESIEEKIAEYIPKENLFLNKSFSSKEEVIDFLSSVAESKDTLPDNYKEMIYEREEIATTAYGNLVAIPHPISPQSTKTFLTICTLDSPINWDDRKVQFVCLLNVEENSKENLQRMYGLLGNIVNDPELVRQLIEAKNYQEFVSTVININD